MPLPPPGQNVRWKDYEITTPTFDLTPVEKPDMSPFLVHMTGKQAIASILRGDGASDPVPSEHGFIRASISDFSQSPYTSPVVCFTESPTFALDFFRYRKFRRWQDDQRFGIGFKKSCLVQQGVRPVVYVDENITKNFVRLYKRAIEEQNLPIADPDVQSLISEILANLYPLLFPLLENLPQQGFMWEREWRYSKAEGFIFPYSSIAVICCPDDERNTIKQILGHYADQIQFVNTWREYNDVTAFLKRQQQQWQQQQQQWQQSPAPQEQPENSAETIERLNHLAIQYRTAINTLSSYQELIADLNQQQASITQEIANLSAELATLETEIQKLRSIRSEPDSSQNLIGHGDN